MTYMHTTANNSLDPNIVVKGYTGYKLCIETCKRSQYIIIKDGSLDIKIKHIDANVCLITWLEPIDN